MQPSVLIAVVTLLTVAAHAQNISVVGTDIAQMIKPNAAPTNAMPTVRMVGPRNGTVSGLAVMTAPAALTAAQGVCSDLKSGTGAVIPAAAIRIRYPSVLADLVTGPRSYNDRADIRQDKRPCFDTLSDNLVPGETVQPVCVTVKIPADAAGDYTGILSLQTSAGNATVPVALKVSAYRLPAPKDYRLWLSFNHSPETVAIRYGEPPPPGKRDAPAPQQKTLPLYSAEHFRLMEPSLRLLGELGNHVLYVPVIEGSHLGFQRGLIHFRRNGTKLEPDFTAFDNYYATYSKYCGTPRILVLMIWEGWLNGNNGKQDIRQVELSVRDDAGDLQTQPVPTYPADPDFWKTSLLGMMDHFQKLGIASNAVHWGTALDWHPTPEQITFLQTVSPSTLWAGFSHCYGARPPKAGYIESVDSTPQKKPIRGGWDITERILCTVRDVHNDNSPPIVMRNLADISVGYNKMHFTRGFARMGLDYWPVVMPTSPPNDGRYIPGRVLNPRGRTDPGRVYRSMTAAITAAAPDGAVPTLRFENLREGIQLTEARILLEKALKEKKVDGDLQKRCEDALAEHFENISAARTGASFPQWLPRAEALLDAAGEVQKIPGADVN